MGKVIPVLELPCSVLHPRSPATCIKATQISLAKGQIIIKGTYTEHQRCAKYHTKFLIFTVISFYPPTNAVK